MTDTSITLAAGAAGIAGPTTVTASAPLFANTDIGRLLSLMSTAPARTAATAYAVGTVLYADYAGVSRLYRVTGAGTTAAANMAGTTPDYDLNAPNSAADTLADGTATLKYLGQGKQAWGWGTITAVPSSTTADVDVALKGPFAGTDATLRWRMGAWSNAQGWPQAVMKHKGRMWFGGTKNFPDTVFSSASADYETMSPTEPDGTVLDTNAIVLAMDADRVGSVLWMASIPRGLMVGTASGEFLVSPPNASAAMGPNNIQAVPQQDRGSSTLIAGLPVAGDLLFVDQSGRKLMELEYDIYSDSFAATELTQLADHMGTPSIVASAYQVTENLWWHVLADGGLVSLTYDRWQKVRAWCRHPLGGTDARAEDVCVVPNPAGDGEDVYVSVARTVGGAVQRSIEVIARPFRADLDGQTGFMHLDSAVLYSGAAHTTFSGINHLEGEMVAIVADGSARTPQVVRGGAVTIDGPAATSVAIGLDFDSYMIDLPTDAPQVPGQSMRGQTKRVSEVTLILMETIGGVVGPPGLERFETITTRTGEDPIGEAVPLFTGNVRINGFPGDFDTYGQVEVRAATGMPMTLLALVKTVTSDD